MRSVGPLLAVLLSLALSCEATTNTVRTATPGASRADSAARTIVPTVTPAPSSTPTPDEEREISEVLATAGARVGRVLPSKFDWLFGTSAPRSGTFQATLDGGEAWADVHFVTGRIEDLTACSSRSASGEMTFTVSVRAQPQVLGSNTVTGALSGASPMYFAVSDRYFVMTPYARLRDILRSALALSIPPC